MSNDSTRSRWQLPPALYLILVVALGLRAWGAYRANLTFDERANVALAETIDLRPAQLHLVANGVSHPLLNVYTIKASMLLFGPSDLGLRMLHVLIGAATVVPVYFLGCRVFCHRAGLWAAALLAVDQFHASWSRVALAEVLMLFFSALVLLQFLRILERGTAGRFAVLGILLGLTYLSKEPALFLLAALWVYVLITPSGRALLTQPSWYLAQAVFLLVISPDAVSNLVRFTDSYVARDVWFLSAPFQLSLKSFSLYLGELFRWLFGENVLDIDYVEGQVYACYWPVGLFYLISTAIAVRRLECPSVGPLLVTFLLMFTAFLFIPGGGRFEPFWWASISLIPAVVFAGWIAAWTMHAGGQRVLMGSLVIGILGIHGLYALDRPGPEEGRATIEDFAVDFLRRAQRALEQGELREAEDRYIFVLNLAGPNVQAYYGLARVAIERGQVEKAERLLSKCREIDSAQRTAEDPTRQHNDRQSLPNRSMKIVHEDSTEGTQP